MLQNRPASAPRRQRRSAWWSSSPTEPAVSERSSALGASETRSEFRLSGATKLTPGRAVQGVSRTPKAGLVGRRSASCPAPNSLSLSGPRRRRRWTHCTPALSAVLVGSCTEWSAEAKPARSSMRRYRMLHARLCAASSSSTLSSATRSSGTWKLCAIIDLGEALNAATSAPTDTCSSSSVCRGALCSSMRRWKKAPAPSPSPSPQ
jgi:hypothetical protein